MTERKQPIGRAKAPDGPLTRAHLRVVDEYMKDFNKKQAMIRAGYSESMAGSFRARNKIFNSVAFQAEISKRQEKAAKKAAIERDDIVRELASIAFGKAGKFVRVEDDGSIRWDFSCATEADLDLIADAGFSVEEYMEGRGENAREVKRLKINSREKMKALDMLCKVLGFYDESLTLKGELSLVQRIQAGRGRVTNA